MQVWLGSNAISGRSPKITGSDPRCDLIGMGKTALSIPSVLDREQLVRIEATHRGYLYQHLYMVACLLLAQASGVREVLVEHDEDIELLSDESHTYIQVKTRNAPLQMNDIRGALERFAGIREAHAAPRERPDPPGDGDATSPVAKRGGCATLIIVSSVAPGRGLREEISAPSWPEDVRVVWPGSDSPLPSGVAPAWPSVEAAVSWCTDRAATIPYSRVEPKTLVLKLAALAQAAAMGGVAGSAESHRFRVEDLSQLFEQVVRSLQELPKVPTPYWPHEDEPPPTREAAVRLIEGPSGSGKSAWAAVRDAHDSQPSAYFAAAGSSGTAFVPALARELAARFAGGAGEMAGILMPGATGFDALRALSALLRERALSPVIVVDDVHQLNADEVIRAIEAAPGMKWILLSHPSPTATQLKTRLQLEREALNGWSLDSIASALRAKGCAADAPTCHRVREFTAGLPLFVQNIAHLASRQAQGNVAAICDQLERGIHLEQTAQEVLLEAAVAALSPTSRDVAELLGLARAPLTGEEVEKLAGAVGITSTPTRRALRDLSAWGMAIQPRQGYVQLHDAYGILFDGSGSLDAARLDTARRRLAELLNPSEHGFSIERGARYLELLPLIGQTSRLIEIAANESEQTFEVGLAPLMGRMLEKTAVDDGAAPYDRFWAMDSLVFWSLQEGRIDDAAVGLERMQTLAADHDLGLRESQAFLVKKLLVAGKRSDITAARTAYKALMELSGADDQLRRIAQYNFATVLLAGNEAAAAEQLASKLMREYYEVLGLDPAKVFRRNVPEVMAMLPKRAGVMADVKRLADTLDVFARAKYNQRQRYGLAKLHAFKFYTICGAYQSAVKTGQDVADDMIAFGDLTDAREFLEQTLLPSLDDFRLVEHIVPVRAQYAVVLAYCGDVAASRAEMQRLLAFGSAASPLRQRELQRQAQLIEAIAAGRVSAPPSLLRPSQAQTPSASVPRPGRNAPCPCGSGLKFKRCHGA